MNKSQKHLIKVYITLKKVNITVRFPCSLAFSLKTQKNLIQCSKMYQLKNGQSIVNQTLQVQLDVSFSSGKYQQKKLNLTIYMVSVNGKIPAGSLTINPTLKNVSETTYNLQKCPDRKAFVCIAQKFQVFSIEPLQQEIKVTDLSLNLRQSYRASTSNSIHKNLGSNVAQILRKSRQSRQNCSLSRQKSSKLKFSQVQSNKRIQLTREQYSYSRAQDIAKQKSPNHQQKRLISKRQRQQHPLSNPTSYKDIRTSRVESNHKISSHQTNQQPTQPQEQQVKILRLQKEQSEYIRQISKLKNQLQQINKFKVTFLQNQLQRVKQQRQDESQQMSKTKDQLKSKQINENKLLSGLKQHRQQLQKKCDKLNSIQGQFKQLQSEINRKQREIIQIRQQDIRLKEQIDELKFSISSQQKKMQIKASSYKEQIKRLGEKYSSSQAQKQRTALQLSSLLSSVENSQKRLQLSSKERQNNSADERNKLTKKIKQIQDANKNLEQQVCILKQNILQVDQELGELRNKLNLQEQINSQIQNQLKSNQNNLAIKERQRQQSEKKANGLQIKLQEQRTSFKRKYNDLCQQVTHTRLQLNKTQASSFQISQKNQQLQRMINKGKSQRSSIQIELAQLRRQNQILKKQDTQIQRLAQTLSVQNLDKEQKISNLKANIQEQKIRFQRMKQQYEKQIKYLVQNQVFFQQDLSDFKLAFQRQEHKATLLLTQFSKQNQQIIQLNRQVFQYLQREGTFQSKIRQLQDSNKAQSEQVSNLQTKNKQMKDWLKQKEEGIYKLEKLQMSLEQQRYVAQERILQLQKAFKESSLAIRQEISVRQDKIAQKQDQLSSLKQLNEQMRSQIQNLKSQVNQAKTSVRFGSKELQELREQNGSLSEQLANVKNQLQASNTSYTQLQHRQENSLRTLKDKQDHLKSLITEKKEYKQTTVEALKQLFEMLNSPWQIGLSASSNSKTSKISQNSRVQLKCFPDQQMSALQLQFISRRNQMLNKLNNQIIGLKEQTKALKNQIQKHKSQTLHNSQQFQQALSQQKQNLNNTIQEKLHQTNRLQASIKQMTNILEDSYKEKQQLHTQVKKLILSYEQALQGLRAFERERGQLKEGCQLVEQEMRRLRIDGMKVKAEHQDGVRQMSQRFQLVLASMKASGGEVDRSYLELTKSFLEKQIALKALSIQLQQAKRKCTGEKRKTQQLQKTLQDYQFKHEKAQKDLIQLRKQLTDISKSFQGLQVTTQYQRLQIDELERQNKKLLGQIHELTLVNQRQDFELRQHKQKAKDSQQQYNNITTRLSQIELLFSEQSKITGERYNTLKSQHEVLGLQTQRLLNKNSEQGQLIAQLSEQNRLRKDQAKIKQGHLDELSVQFKRVLGQLETLKAELAWRQQQMFTLRRSFQQSQGDSQRYALQLQANRNLQQQLQRLTLHSQQKQQHFGNVSTSLQALVIETKREVSNRSTKQQEQRKTIRQLESIIGQKQMEIKTTGNRSLSQGQRQRRALQDRVNELQKQIFIKEQQHLFEKEHLQADIMEKISYIEELEQINTQNQHLMAGHYEQLGKRQQLISELQTNLKSALQQWQRQKSTYHPTDQKIKTIRSQISRFQTISKEVDAQSKQLIEISKRRSSSKSVKPQAPKGITQTLRQICLICMRTKTKLLGRAQNEKDKQVIIADFRVLQEKLQSAMKSSGITRAIGPH